MPTAASSIYWNSVDSRQSSVGSSGDTASARQYVDPWDLENYAYIRRHSVTAPHTNIKQPSVSLPQRASSHHRYSIPAQDYSYSQREAMRESGYHTPSSVDDLYFTSTRQTIHAQNYETVYEGEMSRYSAPVYTPLSDVDYGKQCEDQRSKEALKSRKMSQGHSRERDECIYHRTSGNYRHHTAEKMHSRSLTGDEDCYVQVPHSNIGLSNYGHLKIDYTNSWNSLHRKISK